MDNKDRDYCVYMHTNKINGKKYIGITQQSVEQRWRNGRGYKTQVFYNAIKKYGWNNFSHDVLFDGLTKEEAEQKEIELIAFYKSDNKNFGYNVSHGGNCSGTMLEETKRKISEANKGKIVSEETKQKMKENNVRPMLGKHHTDEAKAKIRQANTGKHHSKETKHKLSQIFKGRKLTPEWIEHRTKAQTGLKRSKETVNKIREAVSVKVICINDRQIYDSLTIASEATGVNISHISQCCNKHRKSAGRDINNRPMVWMFYDEYLDINGSEKTYEEIAPIRLRDDKPKFVICLNTGEVYDSIADAAKDKNTYKSGISLCCNNKAKTSGTNDNGEPLRWMFYNDYLKQGGDICA